jgi:hypothetical protein
MISLEAARPRVVWWLEYGNMTPMVANVFQCLELTTRLLSSEKTHD